MNTLKNAAEWPAAPAEPKATEPLQIVLLPGLDGTGLLFGPLLAALPPHLQPIVVRYPADEALGYDDLFKFAQAFLPAGSRFVLLGESFGGPLAIRLAAARPQGLVALVLSASFISCPHAFVPRWAAALVPEFPFHAFPHLSRVKALLGKHSTSELRALTNQALKSVHPRALARRLREVIRVDVGADLAASAVPLLYLRGEDDYVVPEANSARIERIKPDAHVVSIASSHLILQEQPEQAGAAITRFLASL